MLGHDGRILGPKIRSQGRAAIARRGRARRAAVRARPLPSLALARSRKCIARTRARDRTRATDRANDHAITIARRSRESASRRARGQRHVSRHSPHSGSSCDVNRPRDDPSRDFFAVANASRRRFGSTQRSTLGVILRTPTNDPRSYGRRGDRSVARAAGHRARAHDDHARLQECPISLAFLDHARRGARR